jgi:hypothetical protein
MPIRGFFCFDRKTGQIYLPGDQHQMLSLGIPA